MRHIALIAALAASPAPALELTLRDFYDLSRPASLEFDPDFCGLWIANEGPEAVLYTLDGLELRRVRSHLPRIKAITLEGQNLLVADGFGRFQRLSRDGDILGPPMRLKLGLLDTEGIDTLPDGTILMVEDEPGHLLFVSPDGTILKRINGWDIDPPMTEPQGVARDPRTGHILVVDDWEGTNSLYEFTAEGVLIATTSLLQYGTDPEGIAIRASTSTLFIAFDGGARIAAFDYTPSPGGQADEGTPGVDCAIM